MTLKSRRSCIYYNILHTCIYIYVLFQFGVTVYLFLLSLKFPNITVSLPRNFLQAQHFGNYDPTAVATPSTSQEIVGSGNLLDLWNQQLWLHGPSLQSCWEISFVGAEVLLRKATIPKTNNERPESALKDALAIASSILSSFNDQQWSLHEDMSQRTFRTYCSRCSRVLCIVMARSNIYTDV